MFDGISPQLTHLQTAGAQPYSGGGYRGWDLDELTASHLHYLYHQHHLAYHYALLAPAYLLPPYHATYPLLPYADYRTAGHLLLPMPSLISGETVSAESTASIRARLKVNPPEPRDLYTKEKCFPPSVEWREVRPAASGTMDDILDDIPFLTVTRLWQFIHKLLARPAIYGAVLCWADERGGGRRTFRIHDKEWLAVLWGRQKDKGNMKFRTLERSLRYYRQFGVLDKLPAQRDTYKFLLSELELKQLKCIGNCKPRPRRRVAS